MPKQDTESDLLTLQAEGKHLKKLLGTSDTEGARMLKRFIAENWRDIRRITAKFEDQ